MGSFWDLLGVTETDVLFHFSADFKESCILWEMLTWFFPQSQLAGCSVNYMILTTAFHSAVCFFPTFLYFRLENWQRGRLCRHGICNDGVHGCSAGGHTCSYHRARLPGEFRCSNIPSPVGRELCDTSCSVWRGDMEWCWFGIFVPIVFDGFSCDKTSGMGHSFREFVFSYLTKSLPCRCLT